MPSLERFFDPQMRKFDANVRPLPGARLYFFESGTTTPQTVFQDKQGETPHTNPVIADSTGVFPQIFLDNRLYRAELRSSANIVQPGWPIDNIGQDSPIVPFGPWSEIVSYNFGEIVTGEDGNWYRSTENENLGNEPSASPAEWDQIPIPASSTVIVSRSSNNERSSTTTLSEDEELIFEDLEFNTKYAIKGFIAWTGGTSTSNGLKMKVSGNNISLFRLSYVSNTEQLTAGVGDPVNMLLAYNSSVEFAKVPDGSFSDEAVIIDGYIITVVSGGSGNPSVTLNWAQVSSDATPTTIRSGSYISITKL